MELPKALNVRFRGKKTSCANLCGEIAALTISAVPTIVESVMSGILNSM